jgi:LysM repeat protein
MRDVIAVILVGVLIVGGYFGYKAIFGQEEAVTEPVVGTATPETAAPAPEVPAAPPEPAEQTAQAESPRIQPQETKRTEMAVPPQPQETATAPTALSPAPQEDPARKLFEQARLLYSENRTQEASICLNAIITQYQDSPYSAPAAVSLAAVTINTDKWAARNLYSFALDHTQDAKLKEECRKTLDQLNAELVFSPQLSKDSESYQIQPGDVLTAIAAKYNCPYRFIMQINNITDPRSLRVGDRIKVLTGPKGRMEMKIVVDKSDFTLTVYLNDRYLKQYRVGLGKSDKTPNGTFAITDRLEKPEWRGLKYGDPNNILGDYWLTLKSDKFSGLGIHGTNEPDTVGKNASDGCIRMMNDDVKELYVMVPKGTEVVIQE